MSHPGLVDITQASHHVTLSWNHFLDHNKGVLVGADDAHTGDTAIRVSLHHNWMQQESRGPRARFGQVHIYNNFYDHMKTAVASYMEAQVVIEHSFFSSTNIALQVYCLDPCEDDDPRRHGEIVSSNNKFVNVQDDHNPTRGEAFDPETYFPGLSDEYDDVLLVPGLVMADAGAGRNDRLAQAWKAY